MRTLFLSLLTLFTVTAIPAQEIVEEVVATDTVAIDDKNVARYPVCAAFIGLPDVALPLLQGNVRLDMIDYFASGMKTPSANALAGKSRITSLTPDKLTAEITPASSVTLCLLPSGKKEVVAMITTYALPQPDSKISFFEMTKLAWDSVSMTPLPQHKVFTIPSMKEWLTDNGKQNRQDVERLVPFMPVSYTYSPATKTLTLSNNVNDLVAEADRDSVSALLKKELHYRWDGKKFKLQK